jgi:phage terminase large subunit-like protein
MAGNRTKHVGDESRAPWLDWPETNRAERCIRFIETYCILPKGYGANQRMRLAEFQKDWLRAVLADNNRSAVMAVPRGNGKSTFLAAVALWAVFDPDPLSGAPQVPVVAVTVNQAYRAVYGTALSMIRSEPELEDRCLVYSAIGAQKVVVPFCNGEMFPVSNDVDGLQGLDPSLAVCDEIGFMPQGSWSALLLAGIKRPRSLVVGIGTPGLDHDNALWQLRERALSGAELPGFVFTEYAAPEGCQVGDEEAWHVANPALAEGYMSLDSLRTNLGLAPEGHFRIFHLGQWVDGVESWLGDDGRTVWARLEDPYVLVQGAPTWVGVDVGIKRDSTAVALVQRREDGRLHVTVRLWVPAKSEPVDVTDVMQHLRRVDQLYDVQGVSYDPRFFDVPAKMLDDDGLPMIEVPQSVERMTPAIGSLYEAIQRGEISHDRDGPFAEQVLNAVARFNDRGFTLAKGKSRGRIDATIAMALACDLALRQPPQRAAFIFTQI